MKFNNDLFEAAAYLFEKENGNRHSDYEERLVKKSKLQTIDPSQIETLIVTGLNSNLYTETPLRIKAYWALSKRFNTSLIPAFKNWLKLELQNNNTETIFQLMIALDNLEEPVFAQDRSGYAFNELELNLRDAQRYVRSSK